MNINFNIIIQKLKDDKFCIVDFNSVEEAMECCHLISLTLGTKYTMFTISNKDGVELPAHTEMIYSQNLINYFMILMLSPCDKGGDFVIYDARSAANKLLSILPEIKDTTIKIKSKSRSYSLIRNLIDISGSLVFSDTESLSFDKNSTSFSDEQLTSLIKNILAESVLANLNLKRNQLVIVDNLFTLHSRKSYTGSRLAIRYRIDDNTLEI